MKICRFTHPDFPEPTFGIIEEDSILVKNSDITIKIADVKFLPPVQPSKIVCVGRNYAEHAKELGNELPKWPLLFLKAPSALIVHQEAIVIPEQSKQVEHEGELAIVIGRKIKNLNDSENPLDFVFGYLCLNDVTARDLQRQDVQFTRAKSFDTFCPVSNYLETDVDPSNLKLTVKVNGLVKQHGYTSQMVFPVSELIRYISKQMTLFPGDIIATGTPSGVSQLKAGDICEVEIEGIGILSNPVEEQNTLK
jgi:2-keto-4-pentenoate hydratase/2-oxohepta-3-ene-1,7-dioic acid hydratase in catechol pathway